MKTRKYCFLFFRHKVEKLANNDCYRCRDCRKTLSRIRAEGGLYR